MDRLQRLEKRLRQEKWKAMCEFAKTGMDRLLENQNPNEPWDIVTSPAVKTKTRRRNPSLARAKKQAAKAGIEVARYEIASDGTINIVPANPEETADNPWDRVQ
jgi:hypothetical protein